MKIGLALSGGGLRATIFHLGILSRLARNKLLEDVVFLSTVSGGSLCAGLIFNVSENRWPSSVEFNEEVIPEIRTILTSTSLRNAYLLYLLHWQFFNHRQ